MTDQQDITQDDTAAHLVDISLDKVRGEVGAFNKIEAGIQALNARHPANLVVDVTTPAGMKIAIAARAAYRDPRVSLERARKAAKAPVLELGRSIDAYAADIEARLRIGEDNYNDQIKVEEERKARIKKEAEEKEAARVAQIQQRIAFHFTTIAMRSMGASIEQVTATLAGVEGEDISEAVYAEFSQDAVKAKDAAAAELRRILTAKQEQEAEANRQRTVAEENRRQREELARQQAEFEEQQRAMRERIQREDNERRAREEQERAARQAELDRIAAAQKVLDDARREEADRLAAIERKRLDDEAAAERARLQAEADAKHQAEEKRRRDERAEEECIRAAAEAERKKKEAAAARALKKAQKLAGMSEHLLNALKALDAAIRSPKSSGFTVRQFCESFDVGLKEIADLIAEAEAE